MVGYMGEKKRQTQGILQGVSAWGYGGENL